MHISSSKIISHSLRSITVESKYCLSTNDCGASTKIHVAQFFTELPPQPLGVADDGHGTSHTKVPLLARELPSSLLFSPRAFVVMGASLQKK
jgi:hypothetical protein